MSNLVTLAQVKNGIYTHLAQLQSVCWKFWDISVPSTLFERKEIENRRDRERLNSNLMGWWGPAKGVPVMVFIAADVSTFFFYQEKEVVKKRNGSILIIIRCMIRYRFQIWIR